MTTSKRAFDVALAFCGLVIFALPAAVIIALLMVRQGRPIFYGSERMKSPNRAFQLWKFRTMLIDGADSGVSGGDKSGRITPLGHVLRRLRLDELPQLWNILRGDMTFVGPRPPLRTYVDRFPDLYAKVLQSKPGLSGLATLTFHRHEVRLLAACKTASETDAVYVRACIPRKGRLDLIYQAKRTFWLDLVLLWQTVRLVLSKNKAG